jgi:hypothetical protein
MPRTARFTASPNAIRRWEHWQETPVSKRYLGAKERQHGWTVVRLVPASREPFLEVLQLLFAYGRLSQQPGGFPEALEAAWASWLAHTTTLTAVLASQGTRTCDGP